jgi:acyl-CoA synthetase (NDP forming)
MDLARVFNPERVAVVGVSLTNPFHPANIIFDKNFYGFESEVFAVNPRGGEHERHKVYRSVAEIPARVDMAVIAVKASVVPEAARDCARAGVGSLVVISGGFAEMGDTGLSLQDELLATCRDNSMTLIGPNCFGVYSPPFVDTFFLPPERTVLPKKGHIAVASQSGAFMVDQVMTNFHEAGIGISVAVSMGNKAMVDEVELLAHFAEREDTRAICFYVEGIGKRAHEFFELAEEVSCSKPIVLYQGGKSSKGLSAARSHTGALAGDLKLMSGALKQSGVIEAKTELEVTSFSKMFTFYSHRPMRRGNVAVISSSGGHGVIASDLAEDAGLKLPRFSSEVEDELRDRIDPSLRDIASLDNPIDLTGSVSDQDFERVLDYLLPREEVEGALVLALPYTPMVTSFIGTRLGQVVKRYDKPVVAYVPNLAKYGMVLEGFELNGIPVVHSIEEGVQMLKALHLLGDCK